MIELDIVNYLEGKIIGFCRDESIDLILPNAQPAQRMTTPFIAVNVMQAETGAFTLLGADEVHNGILQVSIFTGAGKGETEALRLAMKVKALFKNNATIARSDDFDLSVAGVPMIMSGSDEEYHSRIVRIRYRCNYFDHSE